MRSSQPRTIRFVPGPGFQPDGRRRRRRVPWGRLVAAFGLAIVLGIGAVWGNVLGAGDWVGERIAGISQRIELFFDPPPDRPTRPTVTVTQPPAPTPSPTPRPTPRRSLPPNATPTPAPTPSPTPVRAPVDRDIVSDHAAVFASEITVEWCAPAGVQMTLAVLGLADTSEAFQRTLVNRIDEWEAWADSHNGNWGPAAMVQALEAYGATGYEIRAYDSRAHALADSARAIDATNSPVILLAWRGAHTWVMTGYRATADPSVFADAKVTGTYILDPWYPRVSSIWGPSDPPGTFQDEAEMERNFLKWARPEGRYPDRDGKFIVIIPTVAR